MEHLIPTLMYVVYENYHKKVAIALSTWIGNSTADLELNLVQKCKYLH